MLIFKSELKKSVLIFMSVFCAACSLDISGIDGCLGPDDCIGDRICVHGKCRDKDAPFRDTGTETDAKRNADYPTEGDTASDSETTIPGTDDSDGTDTKGPAETDTATDTDTITDSEGTTSSNRDTDTSTDDGTIDPPSDTGTDSNQDTGTDAKTTDAILPPPVILNIDGDGSLLDVRVPAESEEAIPTAEKAPHRFRDTWIIEGEHLDTVTRIRLKRNTSGETFDEADGLGFFDEGDSMRRVLTLPRTLALAGLYTLTMTNDAGGASATVYLLQGEPGEQGLKGDQGDGLVCDETTCTVANDKNLTVKGTVTADEGRFTDLTTENLFVSTTYWTPECPPGYFRDSSVEAYVLCKKRLMADHYDEMVKVGAFWIDKYEMSAWSESSCTGKQYGDGGDTWVMENNGEGAVAYACSVAGVSPSGYATWFQAQRSCTASGKRLCTDAEWQAAALGTPDEDFEDPLDDSEACNIWENSKPRDATLAYGQLILTGSAPSCISDVGASDMVGNLSEWVADWRVGGASFQTEFNTDNGKNPWPGSTYHNDATWNVNGSAYASEADQLQTPGMLNGTTRGGWASAGMAAGVYTVSLLGAPSRQMGAYGARCCR